jgi:hypothetical protein
MLAASEALGCDVAALLREAALGDLQFVEQAGASGWHPVRPERNRYLRVESGFDVGRLVVQAEVGLW